MGRFFGGIVAWALLALFPASAWAEGPWLTDYAKAKEQAAAEGKPMLLDFTGSDWCPYCIALEKNVLSTPVFLNYAKKSLVLVTLDHPKYKTLPDEELRQSLEMRRKYEIKEVPTLILLSPDEKVLYRGGEQQEGAAGFVALLRKAAPSTSASGEAADPFAAFAAKPDGATP